MAFRQTLAVTVLLGISATAGFLAYRYWQDGPGTNAPPVARESVPIPESRPHFVLNDPAGRPISSEVWQGKPLVVNFWATWCAPCRREIPMLKRLYDENLDRGLQLIGIAIDFPAEVAAYAEEMEITYPLLVGYEDAIPVGEGFGMALMVLPGTAFSLGDGRILYRHVGELHEEQAEIILDLLWKVEAGTLDLTQARAELARKMPEKP